MGHRRFGLYSRERIELEPGQRHQEESVVAILRQFSGDLEMSGRSEHGGAVGRTVRRTNGFPGSEHVNEHLGGRLDESARNTMGRELLRAGVAALQEVHGYGRSRACKNVGVPG